MRAVTTRRWALDSVAGDRWHDRDPRGSIAGAQMDARRLIDQHRREILRLAVTHGARNVRLFGSIARGEAGIESDVDMLVSMEPGRTLLDLVGLWQDLERLLGRSVDLLSDGGLSPYLRDRILVEAIAL